MLTDDLQRDLPQIEVITKPTSIKPHILSRASIQMQCTLSSTEQASQHLMVGMPRDIHSQHMHTAEEQLPEIKSGSCANAPLPKVAEDVSTICTKSIHALVSWQTAIEKSHTQTHKQGNKLARQSMQKTITFTDMD